MSEDDLLTASRPEITPQAMSLRSAGPPPASAPPASPSPADPSPASPPPASLPSAFLLAGDLAPARPAVTCALSPNPESVKVSRAFTRSTLRDWDLDAVADLAELVVSELVTNALRHGIPSARPGVRHCVELRLLAQAPFVMCMVTDPGDDIPVLRDSDPSCETGRGLTVVEACCVRWGWHQFDEGGKVVWALLQ